ncbi:N-acetylneuraminate 9-O-acetyltransferase [Musca domestica]|uniref:N-acetylneuraminate 9-O-acetyltransferase n=1 Tax=Musca domestica TaxID=7370 RepID=A0A9J7CQW7_MUSDO|nr:N-acetylneuraminate 9-O-acetyltransferase [Musca domestica]
MHQYTLAMSEELELNHLQNDADAAIGADGGGGDVIGVGIGGPEIVPTTSSSNSKAEYFIQQLNSNNFKKLALCMVLGFIVYHGILNWQYGSDSCQWLLSKGRFKGNNEWQPYGCMVHKYSQTDTRRCLRYLAFWGYKNHFIFIGDYSVHEVYKEFINHLHPTDDANDSQLQQTPADTEFDDSKLKMRVTYIYANEVSEALLETLSKLQDTKEVRAVFIVGFTYRNFLKGNVTDDLLKQYQTNLTRLVMPFDQLVAGKSTVLWKLQDRVNEEKLIDSWKLIKNEDIDRLNRIARSVFRYTDATVWEAAWQISNGLVDTAIDGYKLCTLGLKHYTQLLLNMYCNDNMNYNDGSCCSSAEPYTVLQIVTYAVFGVCIVLVCGIFLRRWLLHLRGHTLYTPLRSERPGLHVAPATTTPNANMANGGLASTGSTLTLTRIDYSTPIVAMAMLGIIMAYFYLCDRTNFFMKENKYYSEFSFWIPVGYVFALGLFFTEDSRFTKVLNRDQSDELKGWILLVVLIYYMTGADRVLPIHMHIKLLLSGYLFHTGYTHFSYMWQTGNSGYVRFFQVMFRLNFMTVILCFCMNRPYQFYYFVPLLSFWMCVIYFLLSLPPRITASTVEANPLHYLYLVGKFVGCFSVVTILFMSEVFFERIFVTRPWKALFVTTDDDIHDWWYQWKLDRYTVMFGMIFAACFHIAQKYSIFDDNNHGNLFARRTSITVTLLAVLGVGFYTAFSFLCRNEQNCEEIHSYIVFIPIIGYIILRNISGILRTRYSTFFAWFGRISLELFICQYHIWLAADRHGVLVLLPGFPTLNMIITSFIFVCASHEVHRITQILLPFAVPNDWKLVTRNFIIFLILLIPIAHSDGMF